MSALSYVASLDWRVRPSEPLHAHLRRLTASLADVPPGANLRLIVDKAGALNAALILPVLARRNGKVQIEGEPRALDAWAAAEAAAS